jgi:hypothetical protein
VQILQENGVAKILEAPMMFMAEPGRKVGFMLEDVVWLNIYTTNETDIAKLEDMFLEKSDAWATAQKVESRIEDQEDFQKMLKEFGLSADTVRAESERIEDLVPFPEGPIQVGIFPSSIEGLGVFATANIKKGCQIVPGRIGNCRTPAGRFVNHSVNPTGQVVDVDNGVDFVALRDITGCCGGSLGEEITIDYRTALKLKR